MHSLHHVVRRTVSSSIDRSILRIHPLVEEALHHGRPVVALESTILAHGIPFPQNLELAQTISSIFRDKGVEPATIAVKNGKCHIGLTVEELEDLTSPEPNSQKCSTRDLGWFLASAPPDLWGATTVASTMQASHMAGIATFCTGGIGGVHRPLENVNDVSADIAALARLPVVVVSAGIKSILDIPNTLEALETAEVPVAAYQTDEFPAFFSPVSGVKAPQRVDTPEQVARAFLHHRQLGMSQGMLVAVPNYDPAGANVENAIQQALREQHQNISGKDVTPFILQRVAELTGGDSLRSNLALVQRNAHVAANIAVSLVELKSSATATFYSMPSEREQSTSAIGSRWSKTAKRNPRVAVFGGVVLDMVAKPTQELILGTSNPAACHEADGGVARNIAEVLGRLGSQPVLHSAVGGDARGQAMLRRLEEECGVVGVQETIKVVSGANTATYVALLDHKGDLHAACADMEVMHQADPPGPNDLSATDILVLDANPSVDALRKSARDASRECGAKVFFEPTCIAKAIQASLDAEFLSYLTFASPNQDELVAMATGTTPKYVDTSDTNTLESHARTLLGRMEAKEAHLIITCGEKGVLLASKRDAILFRYYPAEHSVHVENATGAGDTLSGAFVHALLQNATIEEAVSFGMEAASLTLACSDKTISPLLSELGLEKSMLERSAKTS